MLAPLSNLTPTLPGTEAGSPVGQRKAASCGADGEDSALPAGIAPRPLRGCSRRFSKAERGLRTTHLGWERQFAGGGFAAFAKLVGAYGGLRRKNIKSIAARRMYLADEK